MAHPPDKDKYSVVVVKRAGLPIRWQWEIYRDGQPLPVQLRVGNFRLESTAEAAGKVAPREFPSIANKS